MVEDKLRNLYEKRVEEIGVSIKKNYGNADCIYNTTKIMASLFILINKIEIEQDKKDKITQKLEDFLNSVVKEIEIRDEYFYESGYKDGKNERKE